MPNKLCAAVDVWGQLQASAGQRPDCLYTHTASATSKSLHTHLNPPYRSRQQADEQSYSPSAPVDPAESFRHAAPPPCPCRPNSCSLWPISPPADTAITSFFTRTTFRPLLCHHQLSPRETKSGGRDILGWASVRVQHVWHSKWCGRWCGDRGIGDQISEDERKTYFIRDPHLRRPAIADLIHLGSIFWIFGRR